MPTLAKPNIGNEPKRPMHSAVWRNIRLLLSSALLCCRRWCQRVAEVCDVRGTLCPEITVCLDLGEGMGSSALMWRAPAPGVRSLNQRAAAGAG